jgi:hypothetical protein
MTLDRSFVEKNRAATQRMRALADRLRDAELLRPVGEHWTVAVVFIHLAFWDRRALDVLERTEREGKLSAPEINFVINDISLPLWEAIPPSEAVRIALEAAGALDRRLEAFPPELLESIFELNPRWVDRSIHRNLHLAEAEAALEAR